LDIHASRFQPPASDSAPKTQDTSGRLSQPELLQCDQVSVSLKTSRDISALGFPTCCKTWPEWVTERRGAWRQRVNAARLTRGKESSSWPTISVNESKNSVGKSQEHRNSIPLGTMAVILHGQADPASSSSHGSRQGLWQTPKATNADCPVIHNPQRSDGGQPNLAAQMMLEQELYWRTPQAQEAGAKVETLFTKDGSPAMPGQRAYRKTPSGKLVLQSQTINQQVEMVENWATPQAHDAQGPKTPEQIAAMRAKGHGVKNLNEMVSWATPCSRDHHPNGQAQGSKTDLGNQVAQWGTPTARDHKSGRGNEEREYKELTPMVERTQAGKLNQNWVCCLMGVPMGWVDPMCPVSVIKSWPRFVIGWLRAQTAPIPCDSSAMESCLPPQSELSEFSLAS
jgi:hypothetical protein